jgi:molybdate transport system substrate-binding protein
MLAAVTGRIVFLAMWVLGCGAAGPRELKVSAAMSLKEAFVEFEAEFEARHPGIDVIYNFAGSQILAAQIVEGAQVDVFASADDVQMQRAIGSGRVGTPMVFASSRVVLITPVDDPGKIADVGDLTRTGVRLVLAGPTVPAGAYAREALGRLGVRELALANVVSNEENVRGVVGKVASGEADAGVVYATDVTPAVAAKLRVIELNVDVTPKYEVAPVKDGLHPPLARAFAGELVGPEGQAVLARHGFARP